MAQRRTVALATIEYPPDPLSAGIGSYTRRLAELLVARGHRVHVVARAFAQEPTGSASVEGGEDLVVHRVGPVRPELPEGFAGARALAFAAGAVRSEWLYRRAVARTLRELVDDAGVELIEAADHLAEPILYRPSRRPSVPFVVRLHTPLAYAETVEPVLPGYARAFVAAVERRFVRSASHVSAPTRTAATMMRSGMRLGALPIVVHANPVSVPDVPAEPRPARPGQPPTVLFVGRIRKWKGVHLLAQAIPAVHARVPDARFVFVGSDHVPSDGFPDTGSALLARLPEAHRDRVAFRGHVAPEALGALYDDATVCVFPSLFESFSYVCLEAMVHGKPIIGSARGGMAELLDHGAAGVVIDPVDVGRLGKEVADLLLDPERRAELGRRARRRVDEVYAPARVIDEVEAFYERAIEESS